MSWKTNIAITVLLMCTGPSYALIPCEVARLSPSDETEQFGYSIGVSGEYVVVGAPGDSTDPPNYWHAGAIYVFQRVEGEWVEQVKLFASDREIFDNFGASVAIAATSSLSERPANPGGRKGRGPTSSGGQVRPGPRSRSLFAQAPKTPLSSAGPSPSVVT